MKNKKDFIPEPMFRFAVAVLVVVAIIGLTLISVEIEKNYEIVRRIPADTTVESTQSQHSQKSLKPVQPDSVGKYQLKADVSVGENVPNEYLTIESTGAGFLTDKTMVLFPYKEGSFDFYESGVLVASIPLDSVQTMKKEELKNFKLALEIISFVHDKLKPHYGKASDAFVFAAIEILPERFKRK